MTGDFICSVCGQSSLRVVRALELPTAGLNDEMALQVTQCEKCTFLGVAIYLESQRGEVDSGSWHHNGYSLNESDWRNLMHTIDQCPSSFYKECECQTHKAFESTNEQSVLERLSQLGLSPNNEFDMEKSLE